MYVCLGKHGSCGNCLLVVLRGGVVQSATVRPAGADAGCSGTADGLVGGLVQTYPNLVQY